MTEEEPICLNFPSSCLGTCINGSCISCPPRWVHEKSFFRLENCAEPESFELTLGLVVIGVCLFPLIFLLIRIPKARSKVKKILSFALCITIGLILSGICLAVQQKVGPAFYFFFMLACGSNTATLCMTIWAHFEVTYRSNRKVFPNKLATFSFIASVLLITLPVFIMFIGSFVTNPVTYNTIIGISFALVPIHLILTFPLLVYGIKELVSIIEVTTNEQHVSKQGNDNRHIILLQRLKYFRIFMVLMTLSEIIVCGTPPTLYFAFRLPMFSWIFLVITFLANICCIYAYCYANRSISSSTGESSQVSGNQSKVQMDESTVIPIKN